MKNTTLLILFVIPLLFSLCTEPLEPQNNDSTELTDNKYVSGYAILLATSNHPTGIMKVLIEDHVLRGVHYEYDDNQRFNVFDDLKFKLREENGIQKAYDIQSIEAEGEMLATTDVILLDEKIKMNLHNAVYNSFTHDQYKIHRAGHVLNDDSENRSQQITIGGKEYIPVKICTDESGSDCEGEYYMKPSDFDRFEQLQNQGKKTYFQIIQILDDNGNEIDVIMDVTDVHIHFGDKEPWPDK